MSSDVNEMSYGKCHDCEFSRTIYDEGGGVIINCLVTFRSLRIDSCPRCF